MVRAVFMLLGCDDDDDDDGGGAFWEAAGLFSSS